MTIMVVNFSITMQDLWQDSEFIMVIANDNGKHDDKNLFVEILG